MAETGTSVGEISGQSKPINSVDFRPARPFRIVTASEDNTIAVFEGPPFKFKCTKQVMIFCGDFLVITFGSGVGLLVWLLVMTLCGTFGDDFMVMTFGDDSWWWLLVMTFAYDYWWWILVLWNFLIIWNSGNNWDSKNFIRKNLSFTFHMMNLTYNIHFPLNFKSTSNIKYCI